MSVQIKKKKNMLGFENKFQLYRVSYKSHKKLLVMGVLFSFPHKSNNVCSEKKRKKKKKKNKKKKKKNILGFWEYLPCRCFKGVDETGTRIL